ncbi:VPS4-associated protein 1 [Cyathus striatus]|nr:VPS4-associated protein 1 [Cyathus striatus]
MSFTNVYYKRAVGTPKACYVCYRPTTTVLATVNTVDFVYTCDGHLADSGFATCLSDGDAGGRSTVVTAEEIAKVKAEWEEKQKKKQEKAEEKEKEKEKDEKGGDKKDGKGKEDDKNKKDSKVAAPLARAVGHEKYALHRDYFGMRQAEHRRRRQAAQAKELAPRLPGAPRGGV